MYGQVYGSITTDSLGIASIHIETGSMLVAIATKDGFTTVESELEVDLTKSITLTLPMAYIATTSASTTVTTPTEASTTYTEATTAETTTAEIITETTKAETITAETPLFKSSKIITPETPTSEISTEATMSPLADPNFRFVTLSGADNSFVPGVSTVYTVNGGASQSITSDSQGQANIYIPDGAEVEATGSIDGYINSANTLVVDLSKSTALTLTLVPSLAETTEFKTVLNWGTEPRDLELKALQYSGADCIISFAGSCEGVTYDLDNVNGGDNGAEAITWSSTSTPFKYIIYVTTYETEPGIFINSQVTIHSQELLFAVTTHGGIVSLTTTIYNFRLV